MIVNYHTHTPRCRHASGSEEEYVRCALDAGLKKLGFSDHSPYLFPGSYYSTFRMFPQELADYARTVRALREQYADQLDIRLGVEAEYYPDLFSDLLTLLRSEGIEYMILGQHCLGNEQGGHYCGHETDSKSHLIQYCDQSIEALHTGLFTYFAHPDLIYFTGSDDLYAQHIRRLCRAAKDCNVPLEINLLGLRTNRHYPNPRFWEIAAEEGNDVILGSDAHQPEHLLDTATERKALEMVKAYGLKLLTDVPLRPIK